jgi:HEAT repeat protein
VIQRLARALKIYPAEGALAAMLVAMMLSASAGSSIGGASIDALFFTRFGVQYLPYAYIAIGAVNFINLILIAGLSGRFSRSSLYTTLPVLLAALLIGSRLVLALHQSWFYPVLYVGKELFNALQGVFMWGMASALLDARQAKRLFPLMTAGTISGTVLGSFGTPLLVRAFGSENMLVAWALASALAAWLVFRLIRREKSRAGPASAFGPKKRSQAQGLASLFTEIQQGYGYVRRSSLMRWWSAAAVLFSILWFSLLLPFSRAAAHRYPDADAMTSFFGLFNGLQTAAALLVSLFLANRLFARFGLVNMLVIYPLIYLGGFISLLFFPFFPVIAGARFIKLTWSNSVAEPAWNAAYNAIPLERRDQARAFINAVPGQAGIIISGLLLVIGDQALQPRQLYMIGLVMAILCALVIWKGKRAYVEALGEALRSGQPQVFIAEAEPFGAFRDAESLRVALAGLAAADAMERRISAEILGHMPGTESLGALMGVLADQDADVRVAALGSLALLGSLPDPARVAAQLADPQPEVRRAAVEALMKLAADDPSVQAAIRPLFQDADPGVRARAAVALAAGPEVDQAEQTLLEMAAAEEAETRVEAVRALGACWDTVRTHPSMKQIIAGALADPAAGVRSAAMQALQDPPLEFLFDFIRALGDSDRSVQTSAAAALGRAGEPVLGLVMDALQDAQLEPGALMALEALPAGRVREDIRRHVLKKVDQALRDADWAARVQPDGDERARLLAESIHARARQQALLALQALGLLLDRPSIALAVGNLKSHHPEQRAYALETLETMEGAEIVRPVLSLWEQAGGTPAISALPWPEVLADQDAWIRACAVFAAEKNPDSELPAVIRQLAESDPDELVRATARLAVPGGTPMDTLKTLSIMERILFLRRVALFAEMSPGDLKQVASIASEMFYPDGVYLAHSGESGDEMYIIVSGEVQVLSEAGTEIVRRGAGEYVGEMALISQEPRMASLMAAGDVRTLCINQKQFHGILRERPETGLAVMRVLCERVKELSAR